MTTKQKKAGIFARCPPMGWVSYLHRAATTNYLCCGQALEDSLGAGRIGLTHTEHKDTTKFRYRKIWGNKFHIIYRNSI